MVGINRGKAVKIPSGMQIVHGFAVDAENVEYSRRAVFGLLAGFRLDKIPFP